ncbi:hypothetical protein LEP1GSC079_2855 [Leptospira interrogans str. FPW1039]|uniref:Uncharacterized protein n=1 Tax=Leptospira interrogans str. FPW1039 TaxID=1193040 RepID=A0A0F6IHA1_LEPIR|nr:hypothetical protein LEP1GSC099_3375 [Leptospira interrogans str. UI 08452]EMJ37426.1 hypothetical protein LEP1GSC079_2855 [Leptospira interrogans str. FPW1039]EMK15363.1 hypothetical protein LEP1GSC075_3304 [Leptospira interrogans str. Kito]EMN36329.1 hypothetical protein LEP1GSC084_4403 [Leptospira interrogans serovar Medanensis str. L0448]EMN40947.1 hypothetical protein LEP1GSC085_4055 [Leptospira interrogans str. L0996]EMN76356.1 hypothetical protein LEP1GSC102_2350 [Leptospira interrog
MVLNFIEISIRICEQTLIVIFVIKQNQVLEHVVSSIKKKENNFLKLY